MVAVCHRHIKEGLNTLEVPYVAKLNNNQEQSTTCKCAFCQLNADYKLFNEGPYRKKKELHKV